MSGQFKARLESGEVVTLEKECECLPKIHGDKPHWLHMDDYEKRVSQSCLDRLNRAVAEGNWRDYQLAERALAINEYARLREKRGQMECRRIVEIFRPDSEVSNDNAGRANREVEESNLARIASDS